MNRIFFLLTFFLTLISLKLYSSDVSFEASAPSQISVGERFRLTFSLNVRPSEFNPPAFNNFRLISGPSQSSSSSVQIINGKVTQSQTITYTYVLEAAQEGSFAIGSGRIRYNNNEYKSNPVNIQVVKGTQRSTTTPTQPRQPAQLEGISGDDLFVRAEVSNRIPYRGEQVIISYKIYTRVNIAQYSFEKIPGYQGFWTEDISVEANRQTQNEVINGVTYRVGEIRRILAFPQRSGELTIEPLELECIVQLPSQRRRGSPIDEFFGGSFFDRYENQKISIKSNAVKLNVKALPAQNRPASFTGLVGNFDISASISPTELNVNDAANLVVTISGSGNIRMIEEPNIQFPKNLEAFEPNVNDNIRTARGGISGSRKFDYLLIPRTGGEYKIPGIQLPYFDPTTERYVTKNTNDFIINVEGSGIIAGEPESSLRLDVSLLADDIRFIYTRPISLSSKGIVFFRSNTFYMFLLLPLLLFVVFLIVWRRQINIHSDKALLRNRKAQKVARKRLKAAEKYFKNQSQTLFYDEISKTLWGYVSDKVNMPQSQLNRDNIEREFSNKHISEELSKQFLNTLDECEYARFAPGDPQSIMEDVFDKAASTIINIEKDFRNKKDLKS